MSNELRLKSGPAYQVKTPTDDGVVEQIVSVYGNVDSYGERILLGFFDESIQQHKEEDFLITGLYSHNREQPIAATMELRSLPPYDSSLPNKLKDKGGLYVKGIYNLDTQIGAETFSNVKKKLINQYSVGITVSEERRGADGVVELVKGKLWEWSAVLWGANDLTATLGVKEAFTTENIKEQARIAGISPKQLALWLSGYVDMKTKEGRKLSSATVDELLGSSSTMRTAAAEIIASADRIDELVANSTPVKDAAKMAMLNARYRFEALGNN